MRLNTLEKHMKNILISLIAIIGINSAANASTVALKKGDTSLSKITRGEVLSVETFHPDCPINALCSPATKVKVKITLHGCADSIGPVSYTTRFNEYSQKTELLVSAINIHNELSTRILCFAAPTVTKEFFLRPFLSEDEISLEFLR